MNSLKSIKALGRNAFLFISGQTISRIGDMAQLTGLSMYVYKASNNIFAVSLLYAVEALSMIIFGQIGGLFADKMERKRALVILQISQALLIALIPFSGRGVLLYLVFFVFTACTSISRIFQSAMSGDVVDSAHYEEFQGLYSSLQSFGVIIGPVIGAWIFAVYGTTALFAFNALSFVVCAISILLISGREKVVVVKNIIAGTDVQSQCGLNVESGGKKKGNSFTEWTEGYRIILSNPNLSAIVFSMPIIMLGVGVLNSIFIGISSDLWRFSDRQFGWMMAASGIGGIFGGLVYGHIHAKFSSKFFFYFGILAKSFCLLLSAFVTNFSMVFLLFIVNSIGFSFIGSTAQVFFLKTTSRQERGRVSGIAGSLACISMLCGSSISGFLVAYGGYRISIAGIIIFHLLCALSFWLIGDKHVLQRSGYATDKNGKQPVEA
ncbi:MAG TPA: hypothetical protein DCL44_07785 [Elusimicrobia bacterium]|nr:hypothetical protein [Elusimicrobiota bacterium]